MEQDDLSTGQMENLLITAFHPNLGMLELVDIIKDNAVNTHIWDPTTVMIQHGAISEMQQYDLLETIDAQGQDEN